MSHGAVRLQRPLPQRPLPMFSQAGASDCGAACLAMVVDAFGGAGDAGYPGADSAGAGRGLGLSGLLGLAAGAGLVTRPLQAGLEELRQLRCPAILHWDLDHFVVLKRVRRRHIVIHDPARGALSLDLREASRHYTGVAVELWPGEHFRSGAPAPRLRLRDLVPPAAWLLRGVVPVLVLSLVLQALLLAAPLYLQWTVDRALVAADLSLVNLLALGFGALLLFQVLVQALRGFALAELGFSLGYQLSSRVMGHLLRLPQRWFGARPVGDLIARFEALGPVRALLSETAVAALADGLVGMLALLLMLRYDLRMSALVAASLLAYLALRLAVFPRARRLAAAGLLAEAEANASFVETLSGIDSVKALDLVERRQALWQQRFSRGIGALLRQSHLETLAQGGRTLIFGLEHILLVWLGAHGVLTGELSLGMLLAFLAYRSHFVTHGAELVERLIEARTARVYLERLRPICHAAPELPRTHHHDAGPDVTLALHAVGFRYAATEPWLLRGIDLALAPGSLTLVMGGSGQGKSTLLKLLAGTLTPGEGELRLGAVPLTGVALARFRSDLLAVTQEDGLFAGSLLQNIAAGDDRPDLDAVLKVTRQADLEQELQRLPLGFDTLLGERGHGLSVGQRQRVLLARALYRRPRWLLLDEPTASLDAASAARIRQSIAALPQTRLVVSHDAGFIPLADRVYELRAGALVPWTGVSEPQQFDG